MADAVDAVIEAVGVLLDHDRQIVHGDFASMCCSDARKRLRLVVQLALVEARAEEHTECPHQAIPVRHDVCYRCASDRAVEAKSEAAALRAQLAAM